MSETSKYIYVASIPNYWYRFMIYLRLKYNDIIFSLYFFPHKSWRQISDWHIISYCTYRTVAISGVFLCTKINFLLLDFMSSVYIRERDITGERCWFLVPMKSLFTINCKRSPSLQTDLTCYHFKPGWSTYREILSTSCWWPVL